MRIPSVTDRQKEHAVLLAVLLDLGLFLPYAVTTAYTGSLAMLAEILRGGLLLLVEGTAYMALRAVHRGQVHSYDFGVGKLERMFSIVIGALLVMAGVFVVAKVLQSTEPQPLAPFWAAAAMVLVLANLAANLIPLIPLWRATRAGTSIIVLSQFRARMAKAAASVTVVTCVLIDVLMPDTRLAEMADDFGGLVGAAFMLVVGGRMISESLPDLLDRALAAFFDQYEQLTAVRTRQSGTVAHVEITLGFAPSRTIADVSTVTTGLRSALEAAIPEADVVVIAEASSLPRRDDFSPAC
ncbi:cation diffusion facilitator family transporter [Xanthobacter versatilis]|uniref:cation diffusion facilitator family transporter n=1 Tax=Xanthobacter autotrophicus (strain ATCC BAA-1158 / Py2) TaxID=78245 RepID=UPI00372A9D2A